MIDSVQRDTSGHILPHSGLEIHQRQNQLVIVAVNTSRPDCVTY